MLARYAQTPTVSFTDERIKARYVSYPSPGGTSGTMRSYPIQPSGAGPFPLVLIIYENGPVTSSFEEHLTFLYGAKLRLSAMNDPQHK